jgi:hypothetical protein
MLFSTLGRGETLAQLNAAYIRSVDELSATATAAYVSAAPSTDVDVTSGMESLCDQIFYWMLLAFMVVCTVATTAGAAGFIYARFFQ